MMAYILENDKIRLECHEKGGEMKSIWDKENQAEILYQGDEGWSGSNPTLFPMVGSTWTGSYEVDGKTYSMKNHGLIRYATLQGDQKEDSITFHYVSDDNTRKQYPFDFDYAITYTLEGSSIVIRYDITNTGSTDMPFAFGLHPAFRVPQYPGETFEDYSLEYDTPLQGKQLVFTENFDPLVYKDVNLSSWKLNREDLDTYATLVYKDFDCSSVHLACKGENRLRVDFAGFPFLAIWSHPSHSNFLCIEPWYSHADYEKVSTDIFTREGTQVLKPGQTFTCSYTITLEK